MSDRPLDSVEIKIIIHSSELIFDSGSVLESHKTGIEVVIVGNESRGISRQQVDVSATDSSHNEIQWGKIFIAIIPLKDLAKAKVFCFVNSSCRIGRVEISLIDVLFLERVYPGEKFDSVDFNRRYAVTKISEDPDIMLEGTIDISCTVVPRVDSGIKITEYNNNLQLEVQEFDIIQNQLQIMIPFYSVETTIYRLAATTNKTLLRGFFSSKVLLQDLLMDVAFISSSSRNTSISTGLDILTENKVRRNKLVLISSTKIDMTTGTISRHPPIELNCIQLNKSENCLRYFLLKLQNRYSMWVWVKWLRFLHEAWNGRYDMSNLPPWVSSCNGTYCSPISIIASDDQRFTGKGTISIDKPFKILCDDKLIRINSLTSMIISIDSVCPRSHSLETTVTACYVKVDSDDEEGSAIGSENYNEIVSERRKGRGVLKSITGNLLGGMYRRKSITNSSSSSSTSSPSTSNAPDGSVQVRAHEDSKTSFVAVNFNNMNLRTPKVPRSAIQWNTSFAVDVDLVSKSDPSSDNIANDLDLFLYSGKDGSEEIIRQKRVSIDEVLSKFDSRNFAASPMATEEVDSSFLLDTSIVLKVKLGMARDLVVPSLYADSVEPESVFEAGSSQSRRTDNKRNNNSHRSVKLSKSMFANCKLVDWTGRAVSSISYKSSMVVPSANPDFQDFEVTIPAEEGLPGAAFIRIAIYIGNHSENIGSVFVPISSFTCLEKQLQLPLVRFKKMKIFTAESQNIPLSGIPTGLGELTVTFCKETQTLADNTDSTHIIRLKSILRETSVFNCTWYAECLLVGIIDKSVAVKEVEKLALLTSFDGMILLDNVEGGSAQLDSNMVEEEKDDIVESTEKVSDRRSSVSLMQRLQSVSNEAVVTMEVVVFQNERRLPGSKRWTSSMNMNQPRYSDFLFKTSYKFRSLDQAKPPDGFTWGNTTWEIDRRFESSDPDGWRYDSQFGNMTSENDNNSSFTNASKRACARRRKWVRNATLINRDAVDNLVGDKFLFNAAVFAAANDTGDSNVQKIMSEQSSSSSDWRRDISSSKQTAVIIGVCKEKSAPYSPAIIPWSQVLSATVVTPSVLSIRFIVNRYLPPLGKDTGRYPFQRAEMEMLVSNCPAYDLSCIIDERTTFSQTRKNIRQAIVNRSCTDSDQTAKNDDAIESIRDENDEGSDGGFPETEGLSSGSDIIAELDSFAIDLEMKVRELEEKLFLQMKARKLSDVHELTDSAVWKEMQLSLRKSSRARLYLAAMLELNLKGAKSCTCFVAEGLQDERKITNITAIETLKMLAKDSKLCSKIILENEVATANNRIEYLIDTAESCIRDTALSGWTDNRLSFLISIEIFVNGFYFEIIYQLKKFFGDKQLLGLKGLSSKVELISTYMKHNDRLEVIIESALRPYGLIAQPAPKLSHYMHFDTLEYWYSNILHAEMRQRIDDVLSVWKDVSKNAGGMASQYNYKLPWIPQRKKGSSGIFLTLIPEDSGEILTTYLKYARFKKENVAKSLHSELIKMNQKVQISYCCAFMYLSECYHGALLEKDWTAIGDAELVEYAEFLCSTANDAKRLRKVIANLKIQLILTQDDEDDELDNSAAMFEKDSEWRKKTDCKVNELIDATYLSLNKVSMDSLDQLSCIFFKVMLFENDSYLEKSLPLKWSQEVNQQTAHRLIPTLMNEMQKLLESKMDHLENTSFFQLCSLMAAKVIIIYVSFLREASVVNEKFLHQFGSELQQIQDDINCINECFQSLVRTSVMPADLAVQLYSRLSILNYLVPLLQSPLMSGEFVSVLHQVKDLSAENSSISQSLADFVELCFILREDYGKADNSRGVSREESRSRSQSGQTPQHPLAQKQRHSVIGNIWSGVRKPSRDTGRTFSLPGFARAGTDSSSNSSNVDTETQLSDDFTEQDPEDLEVLKSKTFQRWVDDIILEMRQRTGPAKSLTIDTVHPLLQVFGDKFRNISLRNRILRPMFQFAKRDGLELESNSTNARMSDMFGNRNSLTISSVSMLETADSIQPYIMTLNDLKVIGLDSLSVRYPNQGLHVLVGIQSNPLSSHIDFKMSFQPTEARWVSDLDFDLVTAARSSNLENIVLTFRLKGFVNDVVVGSLHVPFNPFDPPCVADITFPLRVEANMEEYEQGMVGFSLRHNSS